MEPEDQLGSQGMDLWLYQLLISLLEEFLNDDLESKSHADLDNLSDNE